MAGVSTNTTIEDVTRRMEAALSARDVDALLAMYAPDATLESPLVPHILGEGPGVVHGHAELRPFLEKLLARTPTLRHYYSDGFLTDGRRAVWEYPRETPEGEQMDFVEVMEIEDGLIRLHHVYWGWRGVRIMLDDAHHL
jgi:ketosteroid isomerase-like protein